MAPEKLIELCLGVPDIDESHRILSNIADRILVSTPKQRKKLLRSMLREFRNNCDFEEKYMELLGYPVDKHIDHVQEHITQSQIMAGCTGEESVEFYQKLFVDLLETHIREFDLPIAYWANSQYEVMEKTPEGLFEKLTAAYTDHVH